MNKTQLRNALTKELLEVCDNVHTIFIHPEEYASLASSFPYITLTFGTSVAQGGSKRFITEIHIIGFVKGNNDELIDKIDKLESDIYAKLYKNQNIKLVIEEIDNNNIFKPFGIDAGIYPPYAGLRMVVKLPEGFEVI